jgi:hypothetical protein
VSDAEVPIDLPGGGYQWRGRLLAQVQASGPLPMLQVYRASEIREMAPY